MPELLIDVADYCHVPDGPGVVLVAHEAEYGMDHTDGRWGLRYNRKAPSPGSNLDRFAEAFSGACRACARLENEFADVGPLRFSRTEFEVFVNDRALAPGAAEVLAEFREELQRWLGATWSGNEFEMKGPRDLRRRVGAVVRAKRPIVWGSESTR
jgi:hypothetical protein